MYREISSTTDLHIESGVSGSRDAKRTWYISRNLNTGVRHARSADRHRGERAPLRERHGESLSRVEKGFPLRAARARRARAGMNTESFSERKSAGNASTTCRAKESLLETVRVFSREQLLIARAKKENPTSVFRSSLPLFSVEEYSDELSVERE